MSWTKPWLCVRGMPVKTCHINSCETRMNITEKHLLACGLHFSLGLVEKMRTLYLVRDVHVTHLIYYIKGHQVAGFVVVSFLHFALTHSSELEVHHVWPIQNPNEPLVIFSNFLSVILTYLILYCYQLQITYFWASVSMTADVSLFEQVQGTSVSFERLPRELITFSFPSYLLLTLVSRRWKLCTIGCWVWV